MRSTARLPCRATSTARCAIRCGRTLNSPSAPRSGIASHFSERMSETGSRPRLAYVDLARGIAVLLMIEAHTLDAWTRFADRKTRGFGDATILGGFAAPMFLWLAGLGVA